MATIDDVYDLLVIVDAKVDALQVDIDVIKAKTDQLTFTANEVHAKTTGSSSIALIGAKRFSAFAESSY